MPSVRLRGWVVLLLLAVAVGALREALLRLDERRLAARLEGAD